MSSADRTRKYRDRLRDSIPVPLCACGKQIRGKLSRDRGVCSRCWKKTAEGKQETLDRVRKLRKGEA